ncbi:MAG: hypothetical protein ACPG7F_00425 [Aggregatilineales bacterium]
MRAALINVGKHQITLRSDGQVRVNGQTDFAIYGDSYSTPVGNALKDADEMHSRYGMSGNLLNFRAHIVAAVMAGQFIGLTNVDSREDWGVQL